MQTPTPRSNLQIDVACGEALCDSVEGREFLQRRQALFGGLSFAFCFGIFIAVNLLIVLAEGASWSTWWTERGNQVHLGSCLVFLSIWWVCRGPLLPRVAQFAIDVVGTTLIGAIIGMSYNAETLGRFADHHGVLALAITVFARSFIVPSSSLQTLTVGGLAAVPVLIGYRFGRCELLTENASLGASPTVNTIITGVWAAAAVLTSTVSSRILYGLQSEVREAKQLGQYTLEDRIGRGGMGEVYRARHALLRRPTAVKILKPQQGGDRHLARFEREVQLTSQLTHPNTIAIYDYGHSPDGTFYYAMEFLEGLDLEQLVRRSGAQPAARVIHLLDQVCASLGEAHEHQLIHRDIKPANIIVTQRGGIPDFVKVLDFGLVKPLGAPEESEISAANTITGSPMYLSPEGIRSPDSVDPRSDIYAVGAVAYFLLTGTHLFGSENVMEIIGHHLHTRPERPSERLGLPVPDDLESLVLACLEKSPGRRPQSARELRDALRRCRDAGAWSEADAARWWSTCSAPPTTTDTPAPTRPATDATATADVDPSTATATTAMTADDLRRSHEGAAPPPAGEESGRSRQASRELES